jgi:hypothetical protein
MRRILVLLTVALLMAAMIIVSALSVVADSPWTGFGGSCITKNGKPGLQITREGTNQVKTICLVNPDAF